MSEVIIVGGGIIGMLTARELRIAGAKVTLLERADIARESSWAGGGIVSPLYPWRYLDSITQLASWSQQQYPGLATELFEATGIDPELTQNGMLLIAPDETGAALDWAQRHRRDLQIIAQSTFQQLEPAAANAPESAIWMPQVAQLRNPRFAKALLADIRNKGVTIHTDTSVAEIVQSGNRASEVKTSAGNFSADTVVVCAGAWTGQLLEGLPSPPDIRPVKGQMLLFKTQPGVISRIVLEQSRYIIPRRDGHVLFGSTIEETGFEKATTNGARKELYQIATSRFPVLKDYPVERHWAGLRPGSPAGVPYIARHTTLENLFINAGHYRNGIVLGPASARLISDLVLGHDPILPAEPYSLIAARG